MTPVLKMTVLTALIILFFATFGIIINWQLRHFATMVKTLHEHPMAVAKGILTARGDCIAISRNINDLILNTNPENQKNQLAEIELYQANIDHNLNLVYERALKEEGKVLVREAQKEMDAQKNVTKDIASALFSGNSGLATQIAEKKGEPLIRKIEETMTKIANYADSSAMSFHLESNNELRRSKVILFSADLIIAIISIIFFLMVGNSLLRAIKNARDALTKASKVPIDLSIRLPTPSETGINEALNKLFAILERDISAFHAEIKNLGIPSSLMQHDRFFPTVEKLSAVFDHLMKDASSIAKKWEDTQQGHQPLVELMHRINGNLIVMTQIGASQDLIIERLRAQKVFASDDDKNLLEELQHQAESLRKNADQAAYAIERFTSILQQRFTTYPELVALATEQANITSDFKYLVTCLKEHEFDFANIKKALEALQKTISNFKIK